jgi:HK97 family phage major capsid protein
MTLTQLNEKRVKLVADARQIVDRANAEGRSALSADELTKYDAIMADVDALKATIDRQARLEAEEKRDAELNPRKTVTVPAEQRSASKTGTEEYRSAYWQGFRASERALPHEEFRALSVGSDPAGGYTVPDEFERKLIELITNQNVMRGLCNIITTKSGTHEIPMESDEGSAAWTGEGAAYNESDVILTNVILGAHKMTRMLKVSEELLNDSAINLEDYVARKFARSFAILEEAAFVNGNGAAKPTGVAQMATLATTFAGVAAITTDELLDVYHALGRMYRAQATWLLSDAAVKLIRKLKDTTNQYIWQPGLVAGQPDRLLARPVVISDNVPAPTTGNRSVVFGDLSQYTIADRVQTVTQRLNELYATNGQVGFRGYRRVDGKLINAAAVVYGKQA